MLLTIVSLGSLAILCQRSETRPKNKLTIASNRRQVVIFPRRAAGRLSRRRHSCAGGRPWIRNTSGEARHCGREKIQELVRGSSSRIAQGKGEIIRNRNSHSGRVRSAA